MPLASEVRRPLVLPPNASRWIWDSSLLLYLPLWHPLTAKSPFTSMDKNAHSCTVVGAVQTLQGREFTDGNDWISFSTSAVLNSVVTTGEYTILAWLKTSDNTKAYQNILSAGSATASPIPYDFYLKAGIVYLQINDGAWHNLTATTQVANNTWCLVGATFKDSTNACELYLNSASDKSGSIAAVLQSSVFATNSIGAAGAPADPSSPFYGTIGEVLLCNRILSLGEYLNYRQATKWRYRV